MDFPDKLNFVKGFFKGKGSKLKPYMYLPIKTLMWNAENPDQYFESEDKTKCYTTDETVELEKEYYLIIIKLIRTADDIPIAEDADKKYDAISGETIDKHDDDWDAEQNI